MRRFIIVLALLAMLAVFGTAATAQQTAQAAQQNYVVQPGDTLFRISLRFNTSVAALAAANNIANVNLIYAGQTLVIPGGGTPPTPVPGQPTPVPCPPGGGGTYVVVPGDTLASIAR